MAEIFRGKMTARRDLRVPGILRSIAMRNDVEFSISTRNCWLIFEKVKFEARGDLLSIDNFENEVRGTLREILY